MGRLLSLASFAALAAVAAPAAAHVFLDGEPLKVPAALDCPAEQGALTRVAQAADGKSCDYRSGSGEQVRLWLAPLNGQTPSQALASERAQLHALAPVYPQAIRVADDQTGDRADVDLPFIHVHANGDRADVRLFGIHIAADDHGHATNIDSAGGRKNSTVHVGMRGVEVNAEEVGRSNAKLVYVLAANRREPSGYRAVGYIAKGPVAGPLVVAEFRGPHKRNNLGDSEGSDAGRLVDRNLGH